MSKKLKFATLVAIGLYIVVSLVLTTMWSMHAWQKSAGTYTVELEYIHISPDEKLVGDKGDYNCHDGYANEGYPCSFGSYEQEYTTYDRIVQQFAIWLVALSICFFIFIVAQSASTSFSKEK